MIRAIYAVCANTLSSLVLTARSGPAAMNGVLAARHLHYHVEPRRL